MKLEINYKTKTQIHKSVERNNMLQKKKKKWVHKKNQKKGKIPRQIKMEIQHTKI